MKETFKHKNFTKCARKMTKFHLITRIRGAGKVDMLVRSDCCDFLACPIDGMRK